MKMSHGKPIINIARTMIPRKGLNQLYFPLVHSYLNFANLAWGSIIAMV